MNKLASFISYLFHPLFVPLYLGFLILNSQYILIHGSDLLILKLLVKLSIYFVPAIGFAAIYMFLLKQFGIINSFKMKTKQERKIPLLFIFLLFGYIGYEILVNGYEHKSFALIFLIASFSMFFALIINFRFKISLHSIGMAAATGYIYMIIPYAKFNLMPVFIVSLILTGIVGSARLVLSSHSPIQVYMGFLLGWNVSTFTFLLIY